MDRTFDMAKAKILDGLADPGPDNSKLLPHLVSWFENARLNVAARNNANAHNDDNGDDASSAVNLDGGVPRANQPPAGSSTDINGLADQNPNCTSSTPSGSSSDPSAATPRIRPIFDGCDHTAAVLLSRGGGGDGGEGDDADGTLETHHLAPLDNHDTQKHPDQPSPPFHAGPLTKARRSSRSSSRSSTPVKSESSTPVFGNSAAIVDSNTGYITPPLGAESDTEEGRDDDHSGGGGDAEPSRRTIKNALSGAWSALKAISTPARPWGTPRNSPRSKRRSPSSSSRDEDIPLSSSAPAPASIPLASSPASMSRSWMQSAVHSITKRKSEGDSGGGAAAASGGSPGRDEVNGDSDGTDDDFGSDDDGYLSLSGGGAAAAAARAKSSDSISEGWTNVAPSAMAYPGLEVGMTRLVDPSKLTKAAVVSGAPVCSAADMKWWVKTIPTGALLEKPDKGLLKKFRKQVKKASVPCKYRGTVWLYASGGGALLDANPKLYEDVARAAFGDEDHAPPFIEATYKTEQGCLTKTGQQKVNRILRCIAFEYSEVQDYCPWLPMIVGSCLHFMHEDEAFAVASALIKEPTPLLISRASSWSMLEAFNHVTKETLKSQYDTLCNFVGCSKDPELDSAHPLSGVVHEWVGLLEFWSLIRLLDHFMIDRSPMIFYRFGFAILASWAATVTKRPSYGLGRSDLGPSWFNLASVAKSMVNPELCLHACFASSTWISDTAITNATLKSHLVAQLVMRVTTKGVGETEVGSAQTARRKFPSRVLVPKDHTPIIGQATWDALWVDLPIRFKLKAANLIFSTETCGYSLRTFLEMCNDAAPTVLVIKTMTGRTFGAFLPHPWSQWKDASSGYFGSPETFLFMQSPKYTAYKWVGLDALVGIEPSAEAAEKSGAPSAYFMYANAKTIAVGGGGSGHALQLDEELRGTSSPCDTFQNLCLNGGSESFECASLECWDFVSRSTV